MATGVRFMGWKGSHPAFDGAHLPKPYDALCNDPIPRVDGAHSARPLSSSEHYAGVYFDTTGPSFQNIRIQCTLIPSLLTKKLSTEDWLTPPPADGQGLCPRFHVTNVHTMRELKLAGNCIKGSRPLLHFDQVNPLLPPPVGDTILFDRQSSERAPAAADPSILRPPRTDPLSQ